MIIEVSKEYLDNHPERKEYTSTTPKWKLPVIGRFIDTNYNMERLFIGSNKEELEAFLHTLHLTPQAKPYGNWDLFKWHQAKELFK